MVRYGEHSLQRPMLLLKPKSLLSETTVTIVRTVTTETVGIIEIVITETTGIIEIPQETTGTIETIATTAKTIETGIIATAKRGNKSKPLR